MPTPPANLYSSCGFLGFGKTGWDFSSHCDGAVTNGVCKFDATVCNASDGVKVATGEKGSKRCVPDVEKTCVKAGLEYDPLAKTCRAVEQQEDAGPDESMCYADGVGYDPEGKKCIPTLNKADLCAGKNMRYDEEKGTCVLNFDYDPVPMPDKAVTDGLRRVKGLSRKIVSGDSGEQDNLSVCKRICDSDTECKGFLHDQVASGGAVCTFYGDERVSSIPTTSSQPTVSVSTHAGSATLLRKVPLGDVRLPRSVVCGSGTDLVDGTCVPSGRPADAAMCAEGTALSANGTCEVDWESDLLLYATGAHS